MKRILLLFLAVMLTLEFVACGRKTEETPTEDTTKGAQNLTPFRNPIRSTSAADPFVTYDGVTGYYYAMFTQGSFVEIYRSRQLATLMTEGECKIIYRADGTDGVWGDVWAPEMHRGSDGDWYIYTSGRVDEDPTAFEKRLFVLGAETDDPFGEWRFLRLLNKQGFAIDPTTYVTPEGKQYFCCSRVDPEFGQVLELQEMTSPLTFNPNKKATIAKAELEWELVPPYVGNAAILEGPFFLSHGDRLFIIYSANGCWSDRYALGVLEYTGGEMCDAANWQKHGEPLLVMGNGVYGPGHASFFTSPDGTEVFCAYHGMDHHNETNTGTDRYPHVQRVTFDETGYPVMGEAIGCEVDILPPAGEPAP